MIFEKKEKTQHYNTSDIKSYWFSPDMSLFYHIDFMQVIKGLNVPTYRVKDFKIEKRE